MDQAASDNEGGDDMVGRPQQQIKNTPEIYFSLFLLLYNVTYVFKWPHLCGFDPFC